MRKLMTALGTMIVGVGLAVLPATAAPGDLKAKVPFQFKAGGKSMDQGEYRVRRATGTNMVKIENKTSGGTIMVQTKVLQDNATGAGRLVFRVYGDRHFLGQIWANGGKVLEVAMSSEERELKASGSTTTEIPLNPDSEQ